MAPIKYEPVITVSATYGAGGSVIAPRLAMELGLPFVDRLISVDAAAHPEPPLSEEGLVKGERDNVPAGRFLSYFARVAAEGMMAPPDLDLPGDSDIRSRTEADLKPVLAGSPAVILGRAGAVVLARRPRAYHVRLDGPAERRIAWAAPFEQLGSDAARERQAETDRVRSSFVKKIYRTDPADPTLYHLVLDPTVIGVDAAVEVVKVAASAFFDASDR